MDHSPDTAALIVKRKCCSPFDPASSPENLFQRVIDLFMVSGSWYNHITFGTYQSLIPEKMVPTAIAEPWKQQAYKVIP